MGWGSGTRVFNDVLLVMEEHKCKLNKEVVADLIDVFRAHDCDNIYEMADDHVLIEKVLRDRGEIEDEE